MKSSAKKVELASVDDLFTTEQERQQAGEERVVRILLRTTPSKSRMTRP